MASKGNLCPHCDTEIHEDATPTLREVYLSGRDLCARVDCPGCGELVEIRGRKFVTFEVTA